MADVMKPGDLVVVVKTDSSWRHYHKFLDKCIGRVGKIKQEFPLYKDVFRVSIDGIPEGESDFPKEWLVPFE